jgi:chromosome segregation ATPase
MISGTEFERANANAQTFLSLPEIVETLQKDVSKLREDLGTLKYEIAKEQNERDRLRRQIVSLRAEVDTIKESGP